MDAVRLAAERMAATMSERTLIEGCAIATVDGGGSEHASGHIVVEDGVIAAIGEGPAPAGETGRRIEGGGLLATPGLVNCHHHLYQWATRGYAQDEDLFHWLVALYPRWALVDQDVQAAAATAGLAALMLSGCTTTTDHHYLFPRDGGDLLAVEVDAALRARRALPPLPRLDGPRHVAGRPASRRGGRGSRRDPRGDVAGDRPLPRHLAGRDDADRRRALLAVLGHRGADDRVGRARAQARRAAAHAPRRDDRRGAVLPGALRLPARSSTSSGSTGSATTSGSRTACTSTPPRSRASARRAPASRTARARTGGSGRASRRSSTSCAPARTSGLGVDGAASNEAGELGRRAAPGDAVRAAARRRGRHDGPRRAGARHDPRRALPRPRRRDRLARGRASAPTSRSGASTTSGTPASTTRSRRSCSAPRPACTRCSSRDASWSRASELRTGSEQAIAHDLRAQSTRLAERARAAGLA